ncbi:MAG: winged helix-turn-helix transcriptional regulator [Phycisphaerae bacterium]|nr:winged helix-turn-helix transcriptional regulator [Phycisphaerae bacterium]
MLRESGQEGGHPESISDQVLMSLRRIIRAIDLHSRSLVSQYGLTGPQLTILKELGGHCSRSVGDLARAVHLSQATVTGIVDRLERRGLVERSRSDSDRRRVVVTLTVTAQAILDQTPSLLQDNFVRAFGKLENWEQTQILSSLQRVVAMMEAKHLEAMPILATGPITASPERTQAFLGSPPRSESALAVPGDLPGAEAGSPKDNPSEKESC